MSACGGGSGNPPTPDTPGSADMGEVVDGANNPGSTDFAFATSSARVIDIIEGSPATVRVPLQLQRFNSHARTIELDVRGASESDTRRLTTRFTADTLLSAVELDLTVNVQPTSAPDIYLLVGQSNMIGFSGNDTKQIGGLDAPHPRIKQLNVTRNDESGIFTNSAAFSDPLANVVDPPIVSAEDPLHVPFEGGQTQKSDNYIGLGLSFAKAALNDTTADVLLVPAAWSGSAFCDNVDAPRGDWNATDTGDSAFGNTLLFERAVTRTNIAIDKTGGVLRGILWLQGESDANERCASPYLANMVVLIQELRKQIAPDSRGEQYRSADAPIPFIVGTMSRGIDGRGDFSIYSAAKQQIDNYHRELPDQLPYVAASIHDDLMGEQWPCGNTNCIHFGAEALREIGNRYYQVLRAMMVETQ